MINKKRHLLQIAVESIIIAGIVILFVMRSENDPINVKHFIIAIMSAGVVGIIIYFVFNGIWQKLYDNINDKMNIKIQNTISTIFFALSFYFSMIMLKTEFLSEGRSEYLKWVEIILPVAILLMYVQVSSLKLNGKKFVNITIPHFKRIIGIIFYITGIVFLITCPLKNLLPTLYAWIETFAGLVLLFFSWKLYPLFCVQEDINH